jgi:hypothetical protein
MRAVGDEWRAMTVVRMSGAVVLLLSIVMLAVFPAAPVEQNVPGFFSPVVGFELASTPDHVFGILGHPDNPKRADAVTRMNRGNWIDFVYMVAYPALHAGIALLLIARGRLPAPLGRFLLVLPVVMWVGDLFENRELLALAVLTDPAAMTDHLARLRPFTIMKWHALFGASALMAYPIWQDRSWWRWCGLVFGAAAILGFGSLLHLPLLEAAAYVMALAWLGTWVYSLRA